MKMELLRVDSANHFNKTHFLNTICTSEFDILCLYLIFINNVHKSLKNDLRSGIRIEQIIVMMP